MADGLEITWENGSDICVCGDWRSRHDEGDGHCKVCAALGAPGCNANNMARRCDSFKYSVAATPLGRKVWELYQERVARLAGEAKR